MIEGYEQYQGEFNDYLDEIYDEIIIGSNFMAFPSQVLFELNRTAYNEQLVEYVDQKRIETNDMVCQKFPNCRFSRWRNIEKG